MNHTVKKIFLDAQKECSPSGLLCEWLSKSTDERLIRTREGRNDGGAKIFIIAAGKASQAMAKSLKKQFHISSSNILCITPEVNAEESYCILSSHPIPDEKSQKAAEKLIEFIEAIPSGSLVLFALSGGTSALVRMPANGVRVQDIAAINRLLLRSGAAINEINGVRKHLSNVKGGQLLRYFKQDCALIDLAISDVPSDRFEDIGSGLTAPDSTTFQHAYDTLLRYGLWDEVPKSCQIYIEKGLAGEAPETVSPLEDPLAQHDSYIIGSARIFAEKMAEAAQRQGFKTRIADGPYNEDVKEVAKSIASKIREKNEPRALIFYGESTVHVTGNGKGGRNQELALRGAFEIDGMKNVTWLSADTDGIDGPTDAAGAIVGGSTIEKAREKGLEPEKFLQENDSYSFHQQMGTLLKTGPTGNNMMDVAVILINENGTEETQKRKSGSL
jgi:glycerate-2-kinase